MTVAAGRERSGGVRRRSGWARERKGHDMRMNPQIRAQWVAALRSGEYQQTNDYLHVRGVGYCCLGVLCELAAQAGVIDADEVAIGERNDAEVEVTSYGDASWRSEQHLPKPVIEWAGIVQERSNFGDASDPFVRRPEGLPDGAVGSLGYVSLVALNDSAGWSFEQIASAIEADGRGQE